MNKPPAQRGSSPTGTALQELHKELFARKQLDDYGVLGVPHGADDATIRAAYLEQSKRYHPHRHTRFGPEHRRVATEMYVLVQRAYARLSGSERMPNHDGEQRKHAVRRSARDELDKSVSAAVEQLQHNQFADAIELLTKVVRQDPERANARLWLTVAGARLALSRGETAKAIECYRAVQQMQPSHVEARDKLAELTAPKAPEPGLLGRLFGRKG